MASLWHVRLSSSQWDEILRVGPVNPIAWEDLELARSGGLGVVGEGFLISFIESSFIAGTRLFVGGGNGCVRIF